MAACQSDSGINIGDTAMEVTAEQRSKFLSLLAEAGEDALAKMTKECLDVQYCLDDSVGFRSHIANEVSRFSYSADVDEYLIYRQDQEKEYLAESDSSIERSDEASKELDVLIEQSVKDGEAFLEEMNSFIAADRKLEQDIEDYNNVLKAREPFDKEFDQLMGSCEKLDEEIEQFLNNPS